MRVLDPSRVELLAAIGCEVNIAAERRSCGGVVHRADPTRGGLVEIVGFYTPDYLARKLALKLAKRNDSRDSFFPSR